MTNSQQNVPKAASGRLDETALRAEGITVRFGGLVALNRVNISVTAGAVTGLVGPNGAGKTTLFSVLSGLRRPNEGRVHLAGKDITGVAPQTRARLGLARTFQQPELFLGLTVREHMILGYRARHAKSRIWTDLLAAGSLRRPDDVETERVDALVDMLSLGPVADQLVASLPLGTSRLVEVGRALATSPTVLLLDEPLSGLDVYEASRLADALQRTLEQENIGMLLVEHDVATVLRLSRRVTVLDFGVEIAEGLPEEIRASPQVRAAYLGDENLQPARGIEEKQDQA